MKFRAITFNRAYGDYYHLINEKLQARDHVLEIGGGAYPSIEQRSNLSYTIIDPDMKELEKSPEDCHKICAAIQDYQGEKTFDHIISKMVLEHVEDPNSFHAKILGLLNEKGRVIHFFACRHSVPAFVNRILPEAFGDFILKLLQNRNTIDHPKYPAYYKRTKGGVRSQIKYFEEMGYQVEEYRSFVGHKYFRSIPVLKQIEQLYTWMLVQLQMKSLATVALVVLKKK